MHNCGAVKTDNSASVSHTDETEQDTCSICLQEYKGPSPKNPTFVGTLLNCIRTLSPIKDTRVSTLCNHHYHATCLFKHCCGGAPTCPLCRTVLFKLENDKEELIYSHFNSKAQKRDDMLLLVPGLGLGPNDLKPSEVFTTLPSKLALILPIPSLIAILTSLSQLCKVFRTIDNLKDLVHSIVIFYLVLIILGHCMILFSALVTAFKLWSNFRFSMIEYVKLVYTANKIFILSLISLNLFYPMILWILEYDFMFRLGISLFGIYVMLALVSVFMEYYEKHPLKMNAFITLAIIFQIYMRQSCTNEFCDAMWSTRYSILLLLSAYLRTFTESMVFGWLRARLGLDLTAHHLVFRIIYLE